MMSRLSQRMSVGTPTQAQAVRALRQRLGDSAEREDRKGVIKPR